MQKSKGSGPRGCERYFDVKEIAQADLCETVLMVRVKGDSEASAFPCSFASTGGTSLTVFWKPARKGMDGASRVMVFVLRVSQVRYCRN